MASIMKIVHVIRVMEKLKRFTLQKGHLSIVTNVKNKLLLTNKEQKDTNFSLYAKYQIRN